MKYIKKFVIKKCCKKSFESNQYTSQEEMINAALKKANIIYFVLHFLYLLCFSLLTGLAAILFPSLFAQANIIGILIFIPFFIIFIKVLFNLSSFSKNCITKEDIINVI